MSICIPPTQLNMKLSVEISLLHLASRWNILAFIQSLSSLLPVERIDARPSKAFGSSTSFAGFQIRVLEHTLQATLSSLGLIF